ncbi:MAG: MFS transporter, partial [Aeromicrobium sp.]
GASLSIIGFTISLHIAGMFALSPVFGWMTDRWGAEPTILLGQALLILACGVAGTAGDSTVQITIGLVLLGVGWSMSVIAGAALVTQSVAAEVRPLVQGFSDLTMNLAGAAGGLVAGVVVALWSFGALSAVAGLLTLPVVAAIVYASRPPATRLT